MKRLLLTLTVALIGLAAKAQSTNLPPAPPLTYTNGLSIRLPLSDQALSVLVYSRAVTGQTNVPMAQYATNALIIAPNPQVQALMAQRRNAVIQRLYRASATQMSAIENALGQP